MLDDPAVTSGLLPGQRPADRRRMWAPWRLQYIGGARTEGCVFCHYRDGDHDADNLVLWRLDHAFVVMNLFPYGTGHVMVIPNTHCSTPEDAPASDLQDMTRLLPPVMRALRRSLTCPGFNVGMNIGGSAGAGIADHLHQHVVPRWDGDSNFMPVLAGVQVLPELLPATYARLRAAIGRELGDATAGSSDLCIAAVTAEDRVLINRAGGHSRLPRVAVGAEQSSWPAALATLGPLVASVALMGWTGEQHVTRHDRPAFACLISVDDSVPLPHPLQIVDADDPGLDEHDQQAVRRALDLMPRTSTG